MNIEKNNIYTGRIFDRIFFIGSALFLTVQSILPTIMENNTITKERFACVIGLDFVVVWLVLSSFTKYTISDKNLIRTTYYMRKKEQIFPFLNIKRVFRTQHNLINIYTILADIDGRTINMNITNLAKPKDMLREIYPNVAPNVFDEDVVHELEKPGNQPF